MTEVVVEDMPLRRVGADELDPARPGVDELDTHVSRVLFTGDLAHKWKKPVRFAFVDQSTIERRAELCRLEVELNRRFSPDVYLGVEEIVDAGGHVIDHAVLMRRMPDERRLATLVRGGSDVGACLQAVAEVVAAQHRGAPRNEEISAVATVEAVLDLWERNLREMAPFAPDVVAPDAVERVRRLSARYLAGRRPLFEERIRSGCIVDGHGDLLADDIFCLADGPRILDCLEFDEHLRWGDVLLDIGFLAMDLEHLDRPDLSRVLLGAYTAASGRRHPPSLEHHYLGYRALVRTKVSCLKGAPQDRDDAARYLAQCVRHLEQAQVHLAVVGGLPGTGKSTVAAALSSRTGWRVVRSDHVRKAVGGLDPDAHRPAAYGEGLYSADMTERTYGALLAEARERLGHGESVILDASFSRDRWRRAAASVAADCAAGSIELQCVLPPEVAAARIAARAAAARDPSDADAVVAARMAGEFDPWPSAQRVDTAPHPDAVSAGLPLAGIRAGW